MQKTYLGQTIPTKSSTRPFWISVLHLFLSWKNIWMTTAHLRLEVSLYNHPRNTRCIQCLLPHANHWICRIFTNFLPLIVCLSEFSLHPVHIEHLNLDNIYTRGSISPNTDKYLFYLHLCPLQPASWLLCGQFPDFHNAPCVPRWSFLPSLPAVLF